MTFGEAWTSNDPGPLPLITAVLLPDSLVAPPHPPWSSTPTTRGVRRRTNHGAIHLTDRDRATITRAYLVATDRQPTTPADKIARPRHLIATILAIIAAPTRPRRGGHGQTITTRPTATISYPLCPCRHQHPENAHTSAMSVESESVPVTVTVTVTVTAHESEAGTKDVAIDKKGGAPGPHHHHDTANLATPSLLLVRRLLRRPKTATTPTCQISSMSFWAWNGPRRRRRGRSRRRRPRW